MSDNYERYLISKAFVHWVRGEPLPVDLFMELVRNGIEPECLYVSFETGEQPEPCAYCKDEDCPVFRGCVFEEE